MEDIFHWIREGNTIQVRMWLDDTEHDMNQGDDHQFSPLHWAAKGGHTKIVEMLIQGRRSTMSTKLSTSWLNSTSVRDASSFSQLLGQVEVLSVDPKVPSRPTCWKCTSLQDPPVLDPRKLQLSALLHHKTRPLEDSAGR